MAKSPAKRGANSTLTHRWAAWLFRPKPLCLVAAGLLALISWPYLATRLPDLAGEPEYAVTAENIQVSELPEWVPANLVQQALKQAGLPARMSLLDKGLIGQIAAAFSLHPWVEAVERVEKHHPAGVSVTLRYRRPVAMVEVRDGLYPIDENAVLLPPRDFRQSDASKYPIVSGVQSVPAGGVGQPWGDTVVTGAARVASLLTRSDASGKPYWQALALNRIDAPARLSADDRLDDLIFRLRTRGGSRIIWGRAPGTGHPGEVTAEKKIRRLQDYLANFGRYETAHGPSELDIRHWHEISHRALATSPPDDSARN